MTQWMIGSVGTYDEMKSPVLANGACECLAAFKMHTLECGIGMGRASGQASDTFACVH
jgi:hypothetical protein